MKAMSNILLVFTMLVIVGCDNGSYSSSTPPPPIVEELSRKTEWGNESVSDFLSDGVFTVWWDKKWNYQNDALEMLSELKTVRDKCLNDFEMEDPDSVADGFYINVYIHHKNEDLYPDAWGNGVGTDRWGYPYITFPAGFHLNRPNLYHEAFHICQYNGSIPYRGDSGWFIESSANWFAYINYPDHPQAHIELSSIAHHPQLPMWHSIFFNAEDAEENNWGRGVHQYAMGSFLYYLTEIKGVSEKIIGASFYENLAVTPQEYLFQSIGADVFRSHWLSFAEALVTNFDFLTEVQRQTTITEWHTFMDDKNDDQEFVEVFDNKGTEQQWIRPSEENVTKAWSFNTYKIEKSERASYTFELDGDTFGDNQSLAHFQAMVVILDSAGKRSEIMPMTSAEDGSITIEIDEIDTTLFFIVASVPNVFNTNERFSYKTKITKDSL